VAICSRAKYRSLTGDSTTADADVDAALADAQRDLEERTERLFESATRTETLRVSPSGRVYPKATPITSVTTPANSTIDGNGIVVGGFLNIFTGEYSTIAVTYTGGYSAETMPVRVVKLVARMAYAELHENSLIPSGATRVKVGDVEVAGANLGAVDSTALTRDIRRLRRSQLEAY
jgi:hypothetical protein